MRRVVKMNITFGLPKNQKKQNIFFSSIYCGVQTVVLITHSSLLLYQSNQFNLYQ